MAIVVFGHPDRVIRVIRVIMVIRVKDIRG